MNKFALLAWAGLSDIVLEGVKLWDGVVDPRWWVITGGGIALLAMGKFQSRFERKRST